ncbi:MAG: serine dehydratase subunit alpha family protein [Oscillospiraceae bacterium]|nr:serine dehydratase subunit alpha family protein [Oscillospiraceae bacterium]
MVLATGCTEPGAIALTAAAAAEKLGETVETLDVIASGNIIKNAYSAGIPGTGLTGIEYAAAIGAIVAKPEKQLEVINGITAEQLDTAKAMVAAKKVSLDLSKDPEKLYIEVIAKGNGHMTKAIVAKAHTNLCYLEKDGEVLMDTRSPSAEGGKAGIDVREYLSVAKIHEFATTVDVEKLDIIKQSVEVNSIIAGEGMKNDYGLMIGKSMEKEIKQGIRAYDCINYSMMIAAAAADARMAGADFSVVTNSGSGNQGISSSVPAIAIAEYMGKNREELLRAVTISSLMAIYIKAQFGKLSAFCGATVAASGTAAAITYMLGGGVKEMEYAVFNMIGNVTGMCCDGAKPDCALKIATCVNAAWQAALLAMKGIRVQSNEGIVDEDVDKTIANFCLLGNEGSVELDRLMLNIMLEKAAK